VRRRSIWKLGAWALIASTLWAARTAVAQTPPPPTFPNLTYGTDHFREKLDLYIPPDACGRWPVVIFLYGGGWLVGEKEDVAPWVNTLLARRFAIAAVNYRYSYQAIFPAQIHDVKGAVRFLRAHADLYNLDPNRFAVFGESSGGHLSALLGTSAGAASLEGTVGGNAGVSSAVQVAGDFAGPTDLFALGAINNSPTGTISQLFGHPIQDILDNINNPNPPYPDLVALVASADPGHWVDSTDPPFRIVQGLNDTSVPPSQSQYLQDKLTTASVPSTLTLLRGVGHDIPLSAYEPVFDYFAQVLAHPHPPGDITCDDVVNVDDLLLLISKWGPCPASGSCRADLVTDGSVNVADLLFVIGHWG